jgi:dihydrofolate synthase/folylpolyglutamate synthase
MNYSEALQYLYNLGHETLAMKLGLETVRVLAGACENPQQKYPSVHIAGTNGKGSTAALTQAVLTAAGLRAGLFTSPHLVSITERIRVGAEEIGEADFARLASEIRAISERLVAEGLLAAPPTFFEQMTMMAFRYFAERQVDIAVLEVGMGGRLDATNICRPVVTAVTPVGYDHQQYLGASLAEIAREKAGIIKQDIPVVVAPQEDEAMKAIVEHASHSSALMISIEEKIRSANVLEVEPGADDKALERIGQYGLRYRTERAEYHVRLSLRGRRQVINALTVIHIAEQLIEMGWEIPIPAIIAGLGGTEWCGRLEVIPTAPNQAPLLLDGAHNAPAAAALRDFLVEHFPSRPITFIFGAMSDKAIAEMSEILFPMAEKIIVTKVKNPRAAEPEKIAEMAVKLGMEPICASDVNEALKQSLNVTPPDGLICVCGSLFLVGEIKAGLRENGVR